MSGSGQPPATEPQEEEDTGFLRFDDDLFSGKNRDDDARRAGPYQNDKKWGDGQFPSEPMLQPYSDALPWYRPSSGANLLASLQAGDSPLVRLHNEILDFCDLLAPTKAEVQQRHHAITVVKDTIESARGLWDRCDVKVFGSEATKVFLPGSDVDMVVLPSPELNPHRVKNALFRLAETFRSLSGVHRVDVISKARVPLLKILFDSHMQVDISFSNDSGLRSARLVLDYMETMQPLRPLVLLLKYFLAQRELNETYTGGVGSYLLQLMLVAYLQHHRRTAKALHHPRPPPDNLGCLLLGFLRFYSLELDTVQTGISVLQEGRFFGKEERGWAVPTRPSLLSIENPLDPSLDVGKNSYCMDRVLDAFKHAYKRLASACLVAPHPQDSRLPSLLSGFLRYDDEVLCSRVMPKSRAFHTDVFTTMLADVGIAPHERLPPPQQQQQQQYGRDRDRDSGRGGGGGRDYGRDRERYEERDRGYSSNSNKRGREREEEDDYRYEEPPRDDHKVKRGRWSGGRVENQGYGGGGGGDDGRRGGDYSSGRRRHSQGGGGGGGGYGEKRWQR